MRSALGDLAVEIVVDNTASVGMDSTPNWVFFIGYGDARRHIPDRAQGATSWSRSTPRVIKRGSTSRRNAPLLRETSAWSADTRGDALPGPLLRAFLAAARDAERPDGLVVFHVHDSCARAVEPGRSMLGIATLGRWELLPDPKLQILYPTLRVAILDTAGARPVWRGTLLQPWQNTKAHFAHGRVASDMETLFSDLEPAVPKILTR